MKKCSILLIIICMFSSLTIVNADSEGIVLSGDNITLNPDSTYNYIVNDFELSMDISFRNIEPYKNFSLSSDNEILNRDLNSILVSNSSGSTINFKYNDVIDNNKLVLSLYDDYGNKVAEQIINFVNKFANVDSIKINNSKINYYDINNDYAKFYIYNDPDLEIIIKGDNFIDNIDYQIYQYNDSGESVIFNPVKTVKGIDIKNGVSISVYDIWNHINLNEYHIMEVGDASNVYNLNYIHNGKAYYLDTTKKTYNEPIIKSIKQGGRDISKNFIDVPNVLGIQYGIDRYVSYELNNKETIELTLKQMIYGESVRYEFGGESILFTKEELKNGKTIKIKPGNKIENIFSVGMVNGFNYNYLRINDFKDGNYYNLLVGDTIDYFGSINFESKFVDKNNKPYDETMEDYFIVSADDYGENDKIKLLIKGENYLNTTYNVKLKIKSIYNKYDVLDVNFDLNGNQINEGYIYELNNFMYGDLFSTFNGFKNSNDVYDVTIEIDQIISDIEVTYKYDGIIKAGLFYSNGNKISNALGGDGDLNFTFAGVDINSNWYDDNNPILAYYRGIGFNDDSTYTYELINDSRNYDSDHEIINSKNAIVDSGTISGEQLNKYGVSVLLEYDSNYDSPFYTFAIKKDGKVVYYSMIEFYLKNDNIFTSLELKTNGVEKYNQKSIADYIATPNQDLNIHINASDFDNDKFYTVIYGFNDDIERKSIKGDVLNSIGINFVIPKEKLKSVDSIDIMANIEETNSYFISFIDIVDVSEYFSNETKYLVDNTKDMLKSIIKNTSLSDFISNVKINDNGEIKVYNKDHKTELVGNDKKIATGMIMRIISESGDILSDMELVVKGDVNGDGNISITDVVNVSRHLSNVKKLDGVYENAADVSNTGKVTITDLVKIVRDVAGIKEIN